MPQPDRPTRHVPGTEGKIQVLAARAARRMPLFVPGDAEMDQEGIVRAPDPDKCDYGRAPSPTRTEIVWRALTERAYRREGHEKHESYWNLHKHFGTRILDPEMDRREYYGRCVIKLMQSGRWYTMKSIRGRLQINLYQAVQFWFSRWGKKIIERRFLAKIRAFEYRMPRERVDDALTLVENYERSGT